LQRTPVIASNIPPFTEYLDDRRTALLVSPHDPHALAERVAWVLTHPHDAQEMAQRGREMVQQRFSVARCMRESLDFYGECLGSRLRYARGRPYPGFPEPVQQATRADEPADRTQQ